MNPIILLLQNVFLQISDFEIWMRNAFREEPRDTLEPVETGVAPDVAVLILLIFAVAIFGFFFYKVWNAKRQYAGEGRPIGPYKIMIQAGDYLVGNLSKFELPFLPRTRELVEQIPYMKKVSEHLEDLTLAGRLNCYQMRLTNDTVADIKGKSKDIFIVSSEDLEHARISWREQKLGYLQAEAPRVVFSYVTSRKHDAVTPDNNVADVYVISPIPMYKEGEKKPFGFSEAEFLEKQHQIEIHALKQTKELSQAVAMMENVVIAEQKLDLKDERIEQLKDLEDENQESLMEHARKEDVFRTRLNEQPLMGYTKPFTLPERGEPWGWFILFAVAPIASYLIVPEFVASIPAWFGAILGLGFMIGLRFLIARRQRGEEEKELRAGSTV